MAFKFKGKLTRIVTGVSESEKPKKVDIEHDESFSEIIKSALLLIARGDDNAHERRLVIKSAEHGNIELTSTNLMVSAEGSGTDVDLDFIQCKFANKISAHVSKEAKISFPGVTNSDNALHNIIAITMPLAVPSVFTIVGDVDVVSNTSIDPTQAPSEE